MLHKTDYGLVYNDDGSLCVTHQEDGAVAVEEGTTNFWTRDGEYELGYVWSHNLVIPEGMIKAGDTWTLSFEAKQGTGAGVRLSGAGLTQYTAIRASQLTADYKKYSFTVTYDADYAGTLYILSNESDSSTFWIRNTQFEKKPFATSFVDEERPDGILAYPISLADDHTITCYRKSHIDEDYKHVVKRSDGKVFVDGVEDSGYEVGWIAGRNLIQRQYMLDWAGVVTDTDEIGHYYEALISSLYPIAFPNLEFEENTQYTISGKVKWISGNANGLYFQYSDGTTQTIFRLYNTESVKEFSVTSAKGKTVTGIGAYWSTGGKTRYYNLKLEKGSTATHWTPAPEDLGYSGDLLMLSNHAGHIKDLKILPYIATDKEIKQMYSGGTFDVTDKGIVIADNYSEVGTMNGIIGWWPLDRHTNDYSGNNNHGTNNGATITSGIRGSAYEFDGVSDHIYLGYPEELKVGNITLCAWVKGIPKDSSQHIIRSRLYGYSIGIQEDNYVFSIYESTANQLLPKAPFIDSNWHFVVGTYDGSTASIYIDGELKDQVLGSGTGVIHYVSGGVAIGRDGNSSSGHLEGQISDVRIYNRALSPEEIKILYDVTKPNAIPMQLSNDGTVYLSGELKEA